MISLEEGRPRENNIVLHISKRIFIVEKTGTKT